MFNNTSLPFPLSQKTLLVVQTENLQKLQERERDLKDMTKVLETLKVTIINSITHTFTFQRQIKDFNSCEHPKLT